MPGACVVRGERVTLRTLEREDHAFVQRAYANPELRYPLGTPVRNQTELEAWLDNDDADRFLVCLDGDAEGRRGTSWAHVDDESEGARPVGVVAIEDADWKRPELVYWLVPAVQDNGYGCEVVSLAVDYTFRVYDHPAVGAGVYASNEASRRLLESLGFETEGRLREVRFVDGRYRDEVRYGLLRVDWHEGA